MNKFKLRKRYLQSQIKRVLKLNITKAILLDNNKVFEASRVPTLVCVLLKQMKMKNCGPGKAENNVGVSLQGNKVFLFRRY